MPLQVPDNSFFVFFYIIHLKTKSEIISLFKKKNRKDLGLCSIVHQADKNTSQLKCSFHVQWPKISENKWTEVCLFNVDV